MNRCHKCKSNENLLPKPTNGKNQYSCRGCNAARMKLYYDTARLKVFEHYGNACNCCGEDEELFLTIDHINNDGNTTDRWRDGKRITGRNLYVKIISSGFPNTYQLLCMNCNFGKSMNYGICPHNDV